MSDPFFSRSVGSAAKIFFELTIEPARKSYYNYSFRGKVGRGGGGGVVVRFGVLFC